MKLILLEIRFYSKTILKANIAFFYNNNMGWKTIVIGGKCNASISLNRLRISVGDDYHTYSLNDIETIIFSCSQTVITIPLLSELITNNKNVLICNDKNDPIGMFQPFNNHSLVFKRLNNQINWKITRKKKLWKIIIKQKIQSEIDALKYMECDDYVLKLLKSYKDDVVSDDSSFKEASSARVYFKSMFGIYFNRDKEDSTNGALNFGYKIIASAISRVIASRGYLTQLGIHHIGEANAFNLTYDFIEPLRVIVDLYVVRNVEDIFSSKHKQDLVCLLEKRVNLEGRWIRLSDAIEDIVDQYLSYLNEETDRLFYIDVSKGFKNDDND